ncbi:P-loop containing nucleoside triphosphate hydrolase protein [Choanephora cucurbitarum]|nr:P-loop containing nucleoside triphosphate hydrolase protein [Choanephora cucurbitarum]
MSISNAITLPSLFQKLQEGGYDDLDQIKDANLFELTEELSLNKEEVQFLIKACGKEPKVLKRSLGDIIAAEKRCSISTSSKSFNSLLGYGVPPFKITEVCGESGSGKSQICMQLAVNAQLPSELGGVQGECLYIDTEGSFQYSRIASMSKNHNTESILAGIHLFRVLDYTELLALVRQLPDILRHYPKVRLIIIDSIAYHFRVNVLDSRARTAILDYLAQALIEIANKNNLAIVVSNHVTIDGADATWTPSLGSSWGYWCANRLFLFRKREFRFGYLYKSVENEGSKPVQFCIKDEGIADPEESEEFIFTKQEEDAQEREERVNAVWNNLKANHIKKEEDRHPEQLFLPDDDVSSTGEHIASNVDENIEESVEKDIQSSPDDMLVPPEAETTNQTNGLKRANSTDERDGQKKICLDKVATIDNSDNNYVNDSDYWTSDVEEEIDMQFLNNIHSYF